MWGALMMVRIFFVTVRGWHAYRSKEYERSQQVEGVVEHRISHEGLGAQPRRFLGWIHKDRDARKLWLSQADYVKKVLERFSMENAKLVSTPLVNHFRLSTSQCPRSVEETEDMSKVLYASAVGCLMYAMVCTRPDIAQAVSVVTKFLANLGRQYWNTVKWIFRYLKGTTDLSITFARQKGDVSTARYVDVDYAGDLDDKRSTTGYVFTLAGGLIC